MRYIAIFEDATVDFDLTRDRQLLLCREGNSRAVSLAKISGYDLQARHRVDAIAQGKTSTPAALTDAAVVAKLLDAERQSVLSGLPVVLK